MSCVPPLFGENIEKWDALQGKVDALSVVSINMQDMRLTRDRTSP